MYVIKISSNFSPIQMPYYLILQNRKGQCAYVFPFSQVFSCGAVQVVKMGPSYNFISRKVVYRNPFLNVILFNFL